MQESYLERYRRYQKDPWAFLTECVNTLDQVDRKNPIKKFPNKDYLRRFVKAWQYYPLIAVPKSRRMTMSWTIVSLITWEILFKKGTSWAIVSKKEDDADEIVKRISFIIKNIDPEKLPKDLLPEIKEKFNRIDVSNNSMVRGFPQGADQLRQFTFSGIFGDESAFWEQAQAFYSASLPTIDGGGRMILVSSPAPGFFKKLCFDAVDKPGDINTDEHAPDAKTLSQGIRVWQNPKNKFMVFELHYTADPEKRHDAYREGLKAAMPLSDFLREYELFWDTFQGQPVFPEFSRRIHVIDEKPVPAPGLPMMIGFDFGLTPAAVIGQFESGVLTIFHEFVEVNMGVDRFLEQIVPQIRMMWPTKSDLRKDWKCYIDPAGNAKKDTDESTCAISLAKAGFGPIPGDVAFEKRRQAVAHFLTRLEKGQPTFEVYAKGAPMVVKGLEGGYRYEDKHFEIEPSKLRPIKDHYSHPMDALQYLCGGVIKLNTALKRAIPRPAYTFTEKQQHGKV